MPPLSTRFGGGAKVDGSRSDEIGVASRVECSGVPLRPSTAPCVGVSARKRRVCREKRCHGTYDLVAEALLALVRRVWVSAAAM